MKLYYASGACSLSPHIVIRELGLSCELVAVDLKEKRAAGRDYRKIHPRGQVPALELDDGRVLTEGPAIVQYLADRRPEARLAPAWGTFERYQLMQWLNFVSTELHKQFGVFFRPGTDEAIKQQHRALIRARLDDVTRHLEDRAYLLGEHFTVADAYLYVMLRWAPAQGIPLTPVLHRYERAIEQRPGVRAAVMEEGLQAAA